MKFFYTKNTESEYFIKNPNLTKKCFLFEGVKVRKDWLVYLNLLYKDFRSKKKKSIFFLRWGGGGGGVEKGGLSK